MRAKGFRRKLRELGISLFVTTLSCGMLSADPVRPAFNPAEACSIQFVSTKAKVTDRLAFPSDFLYLVEKQCVIKMNFSLGDVKILVAAADA